MSKHTNPKQKEGLASSTNREDELVPFRPSGGALQQAAVPTKGHALHPTAAAGSSPPHEQIAARAYQLWEAHGRPTGTDRDDWFAAERLLRAEA